MSQSTSEKKEPTVRELVDTFLKRNPDADNNLLYKTFPSRGVSTLRAYHADFLRQLKSARGVKKKAKKTMLSLPKKLDFLTFCRTLSFPPYYGLFNWQKECYRVVWNNKISMVVIPRDHGKSILWGNISQHAIQYEGYDVLYLGWTDRRKEVAENIYNFFQLWDQVDSSTKVSSPYHFKTKNGGRFDTYLITSKETLGKHSVGLLDRFDKITPEDIKQLGKAFTAVVKKKYMAGRTKERKLLIFIDDPIDETFRKERHKELKVETKYNSTIANINAEKVINSGTRKFSEDFFYFLDLKYKKKLRKYLRRTHLCTPNVEELDIFAHIDFTKLDTKAPRYHEFMELVLSKALDHPCYNGFLEDHDPGYLPGGSPAENLLCPERWNEQKFKDKREEIGEYWWHAEYEGNPHPITGAVWDKIFYVPHWDDWTHYDHSFVSVDRATTTNLKSSWTGISVFIRDGRDGSKIVLKDLTGQYDFETCLEIVETQVAWLKDVFAHAKCHVVIEKQGGGDDFIASAEHRRFKFAKYIVPFSQTRDKLERIKDYLRLPIKKGDQANGVRFLDSQRNTELVHEILEFPYPVRLDAIDSLATGIKVSEDYPLGDRIAQLVALKVKLGERRAESVRRSSKVYNNPIQNPKFYSRNRGSKREVLRN
ncbi:hypothetical protein LCGC14_0371290 [marine sediment metagenome]|uniref:Terminase large subunit gp17-like C-terminal domain-containing protein n=1 Tax=marine sediment metagenome TaxID=412755 RepID=A0A0F9TMY1_9ZZZZ|nr:hypothetical protein [bacterium]